MNREEGYVRSGIQMARVAVRMVGTKGIGWRDAASAEYLNGTPGNWSIEVQRGAEG